MGRFGIHSFTGGWENAVPGVRVLIPGDATRIAVVLGLLIVTASLPNAWIWPWLVVGALIPAVTLVVAGVPASYIWLRAGAVLPLGAMAVIFLPWMGGGERMEIFSGISVSRSGTLQAGASFLKLVSACLWMCFLLATTGVARFFHGLRTLRIPDVFVDILESTVHYLGVLARETGRMLLASRARAGERKRSMLSMTRLGDLVASLFTRTQHRAEQSMAARESRSLEPGLELPDLEPSGNVIEMEGLTYCYPGADQNALSAISLAIPDNSRVAVLGVNGAGKTTLLLHLNGVHLPQRGELRVAGVEACRENIPHLRSRVGMVFQDPDDQVIGMTVLEDVCYGLRQQGLDEEEVIKRADQALATVGLREKRDRPPFSLSRGERKRAAIAGVLAVGADVLVFDEPMASLDPAGKDEIAVLLQDLHLEGKTIIAATHDVDFAAAWADAVVIMDSGRILAGGPPELLVNEELMTAAGLALPLVARPFQLLRPHLKSGEVRLDVPPRNTQTAFRWLLEHLVKRPAGNGPSSPSPGETKNPAEASREGQIAE